MGAKVPETLGEETYAEWQLVFGCDWNPSLGHWECHGLDKVGEIRCPHIWTPRWGCPEKESRHDKRCPVGKMAAMLSRVRKMKVVVDSSLSPDEIRVADPMVAEWLEGDGRKFRSRVYKEAGYCGGHESSTGEQHAQ